MAIPTERQWRVVRTPGMVVRTRILVPALRTQARHFASRGRCPLNGTLFPLWEAALSPLWSCVPGSWLWLGLWNDRKAQWIPAIASQKQKTLSLNLKASQNAIPRGAIRAWALECVSGTFKWQAIAPHLFVKTTAIFLQVWPYTFQLARAAWGLRLQAHNHWLLRLPKTGPWWMRRQRTAAVLQLTPGGHRKGPWRDSMGGRDCFKEQRCSRFALPRSPDIRDWVCTGQQRGLPRQSLCS